MPLDANIARAMTLTLHFADSELARIEPTPEGCRLVLSAALVRTASGDGWVRGLAVRLSGCQPTAADLAALPPGRLYSGEVRHAGVVLRQLPVPCDLAGPLTLTLEGPHHTALVLTAQHLAVALPPGSAVHDILAC